MDRHTHARTDPVHHGYKTTIDAPIIESLQKETAETIASYRTEHTPPRAGSLGSGGLIATFAAELRIPARTDCRLVRARQVVALDHDVIVQRAYDQNHGRLQQFYPLRFD